MFKGILTLDRKFGIKYRNRRIHGKSAQQLTKLLWNNPKTSVCLLIKVKGESPDVDVQLPRKHKKVLVQESIL
jgi:hypothetical protein